MLQNVNKISSLGRELESHITIKYGLLTDDPKYVRRAFNTAKPFKAKLGKIRHFEPEGMPFDVICIEVISKDLEKVNRMICEKFECAKGLPADEYKPHITIAYVKRGEGKDYIGSTEFEGKEITIDTLVFSPHKGNKTFFSISQDKESSFILHEINKFASGDNFLPSLFNAPNNEWQFEHGGDDEEIALNPDSVSDDTDLYGEWWQDKPRNKDVWNQFISMFKNPFSKKEEMTVDSAYDPEMDKKEKEEMGLSETQLEYSKGFYDPKKHDFPHNTTWDSLTQDGEPSKPTSVTYSPQISNEDNLDQNSPGGFPRRFMGKPKGEWFSNEGEVTDALKNMFKNKKASLHTFYHGSRNKDLDKIGFNQDNVFLSPTYDWALGYSTDEEGELYTKNGDRAGAVYKVSVDIKNLLKLPEDLNKLPKELQQYDIVDFDERDIKFINTVKKLGYDAIEFADGMTILYLKANDPAIKIQKLLDNREAILENMTRDITAAGFGPGYWIDPNGKIFDVRGSEGFSTHYDWINENKDLLTNEYGIDMSGNPDKYGYRQFGSKSLVSAGWTRVGDSSFGYISIETPDLKNLPAKSLNSVLNNINNGKGLIVEDLSGGHVEINWIDEVYNGDIQKTVNKALQRKRLGSIINSLTREIIAAQESGGWISPEGEYIPTEDHLGYISNHPEVFGFKPEQVTSLKEADILMKTAIQNGWVTIRKWGDILAIVANSYYDARKAENEIFNMASQVKLIRIDTLDKQVFSAKINDFMEQKWGAFLKQPVMAKQAGEQSASVPDYLCDEWKTEQIMNDTDEEPYVNHDQRDYPYGMHDSPENTGYNIGWPKDNQPYVVRLDQLDNPSYRNNPFNMTEYWVTYYNSMPADDGIEATNPD